MSEQKSTYWEDRAKRLQESRASDDGLQAKEKKSVTAATPEVRSPKPVANSPLTPNP